MTTPLFRASWRRHTAAIALAAAFLAVVALGRGLSARPAKASAAHTLAESLPTLAHEVGITPLVTLCGKDAIVRIGTIGGKRVFSVFDRAGAPLATRLSKADLARQFPRIHLDELRDVASGFAPDASLLADTPTDHE